MRVGLELGGDVKSSPLNGLKTCAPQKTTHAQRGKEDGQALHVNCLPLKEKTSMCFSHVWCVASRSSKLLPVHKPCTVTMESACRCAQLSTKLKAVVAQCRFPWNERYVQHQGIIHNVSLKSLANNCTACRFCARRRRTTTNTRTRSVEVPITCNILPCVARAVNHVLVQTCARLQHVPSKARSRLGTIDNMPHNR